jgi:hypothetical protein
MLGSVIRPSSWPIVAGRLAESHVFQRQRPFARLARVGDVTIIYIICRRRWLEHRRRPNQQVTHSAKHPHLERSRVPRSVARHGRNHSAATALLAPAKAQRRSRSEVTRTPAGKALSECGKMSRTSSPTSRRWWPNVVLLVGWRISTSGRFRARSPPWLGKVLGGRTKQCEFRIQIRQAKEHDASNTARPGR